MQAIKYVLAGCTGLFVVALVALFVALLLVDPYRFTSVRPFENAIASSFNGNTTASGSVYEVVCAGFDCDEVLPRLPPVSSVECAQHLVGSNIREWKVRQILLTLLEVEPKYSNTSPKPDRQSIERDIEGPGACCLAQFAELGRTEVHIYRQAERYTILLTESRMRKIVTALDERPPRG